MGKRAKIGVGLPCVSLSAIQRAADEQRAERNGWETQSTPAEASIRREPPPVNDDPSLRPWLAQRRDTAVCNYSRKAKRPPGNDAWTEEAGGNAP